MNEPSLDKLNVIASALQQYVLVANNIRFRTAEGGYMWDEINRLFPDLKEFDPATLEEYVYTANNPEYKGNYSIICYLLVLLKNIPTSTILLRMPCLPS